MVSIIGEKILVVDDQPDILMLTVDQLKILGYEVLYASNAEDALEILKSTDDINVIFSDVLMPGMSGIDLSARARKINPHIKIVLSSGYVEYSFLCKESPVTDFAFIPKPYRLSDIYKRLRSAH